MSGRLAAGHFTCASGVSLRWHTDAASGRWHWTCSHTTIRQPPVDIAREPCACIVAHRNWPCRGRRWRRARLCVALPAHGRHRRRRCACMLHPYAAGRGDAARPTRRRSCEALVGHDADADRHHAHRRARARAARRRSTTARRDGDCAEGAARSTAACCGPRPSRPAAIARKARRRCRPSDDGAGTAPDGAPQGRRRRPDWPDVAAAARQAASARQLAVERQIGNVWVLSVATPTVAGTARADGRTRCSRTARSSTPTRCGARSPLAAPNDPLLPAAVVAQRSAVRRQRRDRVGRCSRAPPA